MTSQRNFVAAGLEQAGAELQLPGVVVGKQNPRHTYRSRSSSWILVSVWESRYFTITGV